MQLPNSAEGWYYLAAAVTGVGGIIAILHKYVFTRLYRWSHKRFMTAITQQVIKELNLVQTIQDAIQQALGGSAQTISTQLNKVSESILRNEQMNRNILIAQGVAFWEADQNGNFRYVSPELCNLVGRSEQELLGMNWENCIHPDDQLEIHEKWKWSIKSKAKFQITCRFVSSRNQILEVAMMAWPIYGNDGHLTEFFGSMKSGITKRK